MVRVLQMIGSFELGGSQAMIMNLYRNIDRENIQFDFILDHTENMYYADEVKKLGGKIYIMPSFKGWNYCEIQKKWSDFFWLHPEYHILHSHVRSYASLYIPIAKKYGLKTIIHSHATSNGDGVKAIVKKILQFPLRFQADCFLACSEEAGKWLYGKKVVLKKNFEIIPNAIDVKKYVFNENIRNQYRRFWGLEDKLVIGHVGRFHKAKNHMFLLEVFRRVLLNRPDAFLVIIGDGALRDEIESKIAELNIKGNVILMGNRKDIPELLQMIDIFLFPSLWEGLPVAVVEAQASGLPCVISENITDEVILTSLVKRIKLEQGVDVWSDELLKLNIKNRTAEQQGIIKYDINSTVKLLEKMYCDNCQ